MDNFSFYIPVLLAALTVFLVGLCNPVMMQSRDKNDKPTGHPSCLWLSISALVVGLIAVFVMNMSGDNKITYTL